MTDDERLVDLQLLKQQEGVARHVVEAVRDDWFRRPSEPDLIRNDDAETFFSKRVDWTSPIESGEVHAVKKHDGPAVWLPLRRHIHVSHSDVLPVQSQGHVGHRMWIRHIL